MKYVITFFVVFLFCLGPSLQGQNVSIGIDHPNQVNAGEEFTVSVTITKGSLTDYSRFSQDLPLGLSAVNVSSPNADFSFDNQRIRIIWLKLPEGDEVTVSYKIKVDQRLKGSFVLGGVFAYVVEDERKFLNFDQSNEITIVPSATLDPESIVDIKTFKGGAEVAATSTVDRATTTEATSTGETPSAVVQEGPVKVIRQRPVLQSSGAYKVKMLIHTPRSSKYIKIEETIPSGYLFEEMYSHGGIATLAPSTVKFIWMTLPEDPVFEIEYKLVPLENQPQEDMVIEGLLTYTQGDENKLSPIREIDVDFEALNQNEKTHMLQTGKMPAGASPTVQAAVRQTRVETRREQEPETEPEQTPEQTTRQTTTQSAAGSAQVIENTRVLSPEQGFYYRVQLVATETPIDAKSLFRSEGVDREVVVEEEGGMYKYTVGSFRTYEDAVAYKSTIENVESADGPFIVAYRDGRRVPVPLEK